MDGNLNCADPPPDFVSECPNYATSSCYTGAAVHMSEGHRVDEIYKGCSTFEITENGGIEAENTTLNDIDYSTTKTTCRGPSCNRFHLPPLGPRDYFYAII